MSFVTNVVDCWNTLQLSRMNGIVYPSGSKTKVCQFPKYGHKVQHKSKHKNNDLLLHTDAIVLTPIPHGRFFVVVFDSVFVVVHGFVHREFLDSLLAQPLPSDGLSHLSPASAAQPPNN